MRIVNELVNEKIHNHIPISLHLGSGGTSYKGYFNLDIVETDSVDIIADLNKKLYVFPDNCVKSIIANQVFEHITRFIPMMQELHRICIPEAQIRVSVPHFSNQYGFSDPTHVRFFGLYSMNYFVPKKQQIYRRKVPDFYIKERFTVETVHISFYEFSHKTWFGEICDKLFRRNFEKRIVNRSPTMQEMYEKHLTRLWPARNLEFILTVKK